MSSASRATRVLFLHGLESGPHSGKVLALRAAGLEVHAPALATRATAELLRDGCLEVAALARSLDAAVAQAVAAAEACEPDVVVGSSFGGAVLLRWLHEAPSGRAPAVFLAQAGVKLAGLVTLPHEVPALLVHGRADDVVPVEHSRLLAASAPSATLVEVHDDHRLSATTASGLLAALVGLGARLR